MIHKATAMDVRHNLGEILNGIQYRHDSIVITKGGKPVAALVDIELFDKIKRMKVQFNRLSAELAEAYQGIDPVLAEKEISDALKDAKEN